MKKILFLLLPFFFLSFDKPKEKIHLVALKTKYGTITMRLFNETPKHRDNFLKLTREGFYNGILFHRVIKNFMIQGGDPGSKDAKPGQALGNGDVGYKIPAEFNTNLFHKKGALAAARDNNPEKASSGCQFYIVQGKKLTDAEIDGFESKLKIKFTPAQREAYRQLGGTPHLDMNYTVYGEVIDGLHVIDSIASVKTGANDRPVEDVAIESMTELKALSLKAFNKKYQAAKK
jgi:peptidyl-prolyl cis-trans isomerase B (cyclophilin B)